ncbi:MAG: hypothetical protein WC382_13420 [Methanoregulaceae archaeon]|jgi:hypothetical protein
MLPRHARILLLALLLTASLVVSIPALLVPAEVQVNPPNEDLPEGTVVDLSGYIEIIPSGATTFSESHTLTLSTDLRDARWQVVVMVDGRQAAVIPQEGPRVFVNGFLLSYPDTRDVEVQVRLTGNVASLPAGSSIMVLRWAELNARSQVVTGSEYTVNRQVITLPAPQSIPETEQTTVPATSPTAADLSGFLVIACLGLTICWMGARKRE